MPGVWCPGWCLAELLLTGRLERVLLWVPCVGPQPSLWHWGSEAGLGGVSPSPVNLRGFYTLGRSHRPEGERLRDFLYKNPVLGCALPLSPCSQAFKGKRDNMPPHICSVAQRAYRNLLMQRQDQAIVPLGRSGAGRTACCQGALEYLVGTAGSVDGRVSGMGLGGRCELGAPATSPGCGMLGAGQRQRTETVRAGWGVHANAKVMLFPPDGLHLTHSWSDSCPFGVAPEGPVWLCKCSPGGRRTARLRVLTHPRPNRFAVLINTRVSTRRELLACLGQRCSPLIELLVTWEEALLGNRWL